MLGQYQLHNILITQCTILNETCLAKSKVNGCATLSKHIQLLKLQLNRSVGLNLTDGYWAQYALSLMSSFNRFCVQIGYCNPTVRRY